MEVPRFIKALFRSSHCNDIIAMTNISGYFNSNPWPLILWISELNLQISVSAAPPNQFVMDERGNRINDPILEQYCGQKMLQREVSPTPVPLLQFKRNVLVAGNERKSPVSSATGFVKDGQGRTVAIPEAPSPSPAIPLVSTNPVKGMSLEAARKAGLIRPTKIIPEDFGAAETAGTPSPGQAIPSIEYAEDLGPRAAKAARHQVVPPVEVTSDPAKRAVIESLSQGAGYDPDSPDLAAIVARRTRAGIPSTPHDVSRRAVTSAPPSPPFALDEALPEPVFEPIGQLPITLVPVAPPPPLPPPPPQTPVPPPAPPARRLLYVCGEDDRRFASREELLIYVSENYPDKAAELMEPYPATPKRRARPGQPASAVPPPPAA